MSPRTRILAFVAGAAVFLYLLSRIGFHALVSDTRQTGWMFVPILVLYGLGYVCNTTAWGLTLAAEPRRPSFWRLYGITVSGFALNFVTPMLNVGGEPFRIAAVAPWTTTRRAAASVVMHNNLRLFGFLVSWLAALALGFWFLPHSPAILAALGAATALLLALAAILFSGHRRGALEWTLDLLHRLPGLGRLAGWLEPRREALVQMDLQVARFSREHPGRFVGALGLECASRVIYMAEYYLIAVSIGLQLGFAKAYMIGGLSSLMQNVLFVIPFEMGSKEASLYVLFRMLGIDPRLGVYTAIVTRLRDAVWIGLGLLLVWTSGRDAARTEGA